VITLKPAIDPSTMKLQRKAENGMQYLLRQTILRRNQLLKQERLKKNKEFKDEQRKYRQSVLLSDRWMRQAIKDERKHRREDWLCGPLAPMRDVGMKAGVFGTAGQEIVQPPDLPERLRPKKEEIPFVSGDRVVVVRGLGRGNIGEIREVKRDTGTATVRGVRTADFEIPDWSPQAKNAPQKWTSSELPIPISDLRLIATITDDETRQPRDVVVRYLHMGAPYIERSPFSNLPRFTRYIRMGKEVPKDVFEIEKELYQGEDRSGESTGGEFAVQAKYRSSAKPKHEFIAIPWPDEILDESRANDADTRRLAVEDQTYEPVPMVVHERNFPSETVIDELRPRYARDRSTHELDFVKQKVLIDMKETWERERQRRGGLAVGTPKGEYWAKEMERRNAQAQQRLKNGPDEETIALINEEQRQQRQQRRSAG
jgi:large subunit ribosomal protein L24